MPRSAAPAATVAALLEDRAARQPDEVAFVEGATASVLTWRDLAVEAERWRHAAGQLEGGRVGLVIEDPLSTIAAYLGALAAGVTVAPLNPAITPVELAAQDRMLHLSAVVTDQDAPATRRVVPSCEVWTTGPDGLQFANLPRPARTRPEGEVPLAAGAALVLASSGTTGAPKIIPLSEANLLHTARALATNHEFEGTDRGYCPLPLFHINALVVGVLSTVVTGASLVVDRKFSASRFWHNVEAYGVTWLNLVPAIITVLSERPGPASAVIQRVRFARSASAPLPLPTRQRFESRCGITVLETYGMTEAASQICANPLDPSARRDGSVGRPVGLELRVVDKERRPLPVEAVGDVEIRGANVVRSYWEPAGTASPSRPAIDTDGWLRTGDMGRLDGDGFVYLAGRSDDVINRGGEKLYPREIEEVLLSDPAVSSAAVVGRPHATVGEEPVAFVIAVPGHAVDEVELVARLADRCRRNLSHFKRPATITVAEQLPSGPTGKIRHAELRRSVAEATEVA